MRAPLAPAPLSVRTTLILGLLALLALPSFGDDNPNVNPRPKPRPGPAKPVDPVTPADETAPVPEAPRDLLTAQGPAAPGEVIVVPPPLPADSLLLGEHHHNGGVRESGSWLLDSSFTQQDQVLEFQATLTLRSPGLWYWLPQTKGVYLVVMAERLFDGEGVYSYGSSGLGTTLLTPTGIPVVAATPGNPTDAFGGSVRHPGNRYLLISPDTLERSDDQETVVARFLHTIPVGEELPAGWYRFVAQFGVQLSAHEFTTLQGANPSELFLNSTDDSVVRYPLTAVKTAAAPLLPVTLFSETHPGGGALPDALQDKIGITGREGFHPDTILPPFGPDGSQRRYDLEVTLPWLQGDGADAEFPLRLDPSQGTVELAIKNPDDTTLNLGSSRVTAIADGTIETDRTNGDLAFSRFGEHTITVGGQLTDEDGITYRIGGDYSAWVAMPLDLRVATLPGTPAVVGEGFNLAIRCYPPVPATIDVAQWTSVGGSSKVRTTGYSGRASADGEYIPTLRLNDDMWWGKGVAVFEDAGEYRLRATASFMGEDGTLYKGAWESANVILPIGRNDIPPPSLLAAFGGLGATVAPTLDQGLDFPFVASDLLFIAPGDKPFDPWLYGRGGADLIESRLLPAANLVDLTNGERGFVPTSGTPQGYPAQGYPESRDRMGRVYAWAVAPGEAPRSVVRDGASDGERRVSGPEMPWESSDTFALFGGVSLWDATLKQGAQGAYAGGLVVSDKVNRFSLLPSGSDAAGLIDRPIPYLHQWAIPAGSIVPQGATYSPQCYLFPPMPGTLRATIKRTTGTETYLEAPIDARGIAYSPRAYSTLDLPGVYTVSPSIQVGEDVMKPASFKIYVPDKKPGFPMTLHQPPGTRVGWDQALTLSGSIDGEGYQQAELFFTLAIDGELVEQGQMNLPGRDFNVDFNLQRAGAAIHGFDATDKHLADLTLFALALNAEGKLITSHLRATVRDGKLEWFNEPPQKKKKFYDIF